MSIRLRLVCTALASTVGLHAGIAGDGTSLRLVPFPKKVQVHEGTFALDRSLVLQAPAGVADLVTAELRRASLPTPKARLAPSGSKLWQLSLAGGTPQATLELRKQATSEDYSLQIQPDSVICVATDDAGLFYGAQTLCQLIRANRRDSGIPCLAVQDWPSLRWRCFQDDMTRGPSSTLGTLKAQVDLGAQLKMNLFTYYMEYQYAFQKHPLIGPKDGSLTPQTLRELLGYARQRHVDILGNQQSFGHFARILQHEQYGHLRETPSLLCPVKEGTYQLLDDMYSEICPLLPFPFFNVCCDETWGLGEGPSKELAAKIGVGAVYVQHIRRIHDLLKNKYGKRMMMWGDIILKHPEHLDKIPKDTLMLTWGYSARDSFDHQILPFARSGYEFFVCPGVSNWSRILPDFGVAMTNIHHFVRDGAKHGTLGMLNTAWEDDGEALNWPKWHGHAWGAECAWNASATEPEQFNRRVGAVLFGERGDHFGQAIELLARTHRLPGMQGMNNKRFWQDDFPPPMSASAARDSARRLLEIVRPAIEHLETCKRQASVNGELLDSFLFGARRMELIGQRMLDGLQASQLYVQAFESPAQQGQPLLTQVQALVTKNRQAHASLGDQFRQLWLRESKPYALDWTLERYARVDRQFEQLAKHLAQAKQRAKDGQPLPSPEDVGLALPDQFSRRTRPHQILPTPLKAKSPWVEPTAMLRLGVTVCAGPVDRFDLPIELDLTVPPELVSRPVRAICLEASGPERQVLAQLDPSEQHDRVRLTLLIAGRLPKHSEMPLHVYMGLSQPAASSPLAVSTREAPQGMKWLENDKVRLLLGAEGGHVYRWEVKALANRDLTMPGQKSWFGFSDLGGAHRDAVHELDCIARGPALIRYRCTQKTGMVKTVSLFAGTSWVEVVLNHATDYYWDFDNPENFAGDGPTPGTFLFSNGLTGSVGQQADGVAAQVKAKNVYWGIKFNRERLALGIVTPETAASHCIGPGSGAGGVGVERSAQANHFVTYAGQLNAEPAEVMGRLQHGLSFKNQPRVILHRIENRLEK